MADKNLTTNVLYLSWRILMAIGFQTYERTNAKRTFGWRGSVTWRITSIDGYKLLICWSGQVIIDCYFKIYKAHYQNPTQRKPKKYSDSKILDNPTPSSHCTRHHPTVRLIISFRNPLMSKKRTRNVTLQSYANLVKALTSTNLAAWPMQTLRKQRNCCNHPRVWRPTNQ